MAHSFLLGAQITSGRIRRRSFEPYAFNHIESHFFERADFFGIVRHQPDPIHAEVAQDLRALFVAPKVNCQSQLLICLDCVRALILQRVSTNLINDADAATFLLLINNCAAPFPLDQFHCFAKLLTAVALGRSKHVARQTLGMNTDQSRSVLPQFTFHEYDEFFVRIKGTVTKDTKLAEVSWQARLSHALNCSRIHKPACLLYFKEVGIPSPTVRRRAVSRRSDGGCLLCTH